MQNNNYTSKYTVVMSRLKEQPLRLKLYAVQLLILSDLKWLGKNEIVSLLGKLSVNDDIDFSELDKRVSAIKDVCEPFAHRLEARLGKVAEEFIGHTLEGQNIDEKIDNLALVLASISQKIIDAGRNNDKGINTFTEAIDSLENLSMAQQQAMCNAMEVIIQRLLDSLNPATSENFVDSGAIKLGPLKKAAMFDVMQEKYDQISAYHKEGKMLRDFKVHYKAELKAIKKGNQI